MADYNKTKMYFFKFPNTFFDKDEIEELLSDFDGANTVILYLRLITLATNKEGYLCKLIAGELKPYSVEEISRKTNTDIDDLKNRMTRLREVGLIELKDNMIFIEEALNYTNQTVGAEKKEKQRKKKKEKDKNKEDNCPPDIEERNNILETRNQSLEIINNINNNSRLLVRQEDKPNPALQDICYQVVTYLNNKTFKNFKPGSKKTVDLIKLRLSEGYTLDDFYTVIDKMTQCWLSNGRLEEYLRPITLFGDKFEEYLEGNWERNEVDWSSQYYDTVY